MIWSGPCGKAGGCLTALYPRVEVMCQDPIGYLWLQKRTARGIEPGFPFSGKGRVVNILGWENFKQGSPKQLAAGQGMEGKCFTFRFPTGKSYLSMQL